VIPDLVSTIIPVFNRGAMLREAVACVLAQTYRPIEIVVVDDGSTDATPRVCRGLAEAHPGIIVAVRQENAGPGAARESGRRLARGEFLQYLDSDDALLPRKFELQVAALRQRPECGVAYCKTREYLLGGPPPTNGQAASARPWEGLDTLFPALLSGRIWQTVTPLFRRSVSDAAGPWSDLRQEEDWEYDARVAALGTRLAWVPEFLADFRHHEGPRAGGGSLYDPAKMRWRARAHVLIYGHSRRAGVGPDDPHMRRYARELFLLARQCGALGLAAESRELFDLARAASGEQRGNRWDFRLYRAAAAVLGWHQIGKLACWADSWRTRGRLPT
jgi:glycosyltransferase involved in cell wall biosynthesis